MNIERESNSSVRSSWQIKAPTQARDVALIISFFALHDETITMRFAIVLHNATMMIANRVTLFHSTNNKGWHIPLLTSVSVTLSNKAVSATRADKLDTYIYRISSLCEVFATLSNYSTNRRRIALRMDKVKQYLANLAGQAPEISEQSATTNDKSLSKLEILLNQIEEDAIASQSSIPQTSSKESAEPLVRGSPARRPSFSFLERFLDNIDGGLGSKARIDASASSPSSGKSIDPDEFALPDKVQVTRQIFFDCDNTLVDTEAIAVEACSIVVNKCLADHKIPLTFTVEELLIDYFGYTARKMVTLLAEMYSFPITPEEISAYAVYEEDLVIDLIHANPQPCDGIERLLQHLQVQDRYNLSVVSSSPIRRIRAALEAANIAKYFAEDQIFSAKSSMPTPKSKPDSAIYNFAMAHNKVHPWQCVAFEDSRSGARSAISAGIPCIAYLGTYTTPTQQEQVGATLTQEGCQEIMKSWSQAIGCLERVERAVAIEVATSLEKWENLDERRRQYRLLLGHLLMKEGRKMCDKEKIQNSWE